MSLPAGTYFIGNPRFLLNETQLAAVSAGGMFDIEGHKVVVVSTPPDKPWHVAFPRISLIPMALRPELDDGFHYDYVNGECGKIVTFDAEINVSNRSTVFDIECKGTHTTVDMQVESPHDLMIVCGGTPYRLPF